MTLVAGARLGPYHVLCPIGAGGMGEVYKALDTRLERAVAIKVLPASVAADPARLRLFEREAHAVAALAHANVLAVYDVGTHEGAPYLVTELLEGQTLRDRLAGGPLPTAKAIDLGIQIARGIAAAHEKGIIHRDIKPENLFVTTDGTVKILDFGLAQLTERHRVEQVGSDSTRTVSDPGGLQGTVGYMAPEQARGQPSDHRADIFAIGCVLYEMLSGTRAFAGGSTADTLAAILTKDPPSLNASGRAVPLALQELVSRCLEKEPQERFSSAHDLALALRALSGAGTAEVGRPRESSWLRRHSRLVTATTAAAAIAAAAFIWTVGSRPVLSFAPRDWILISDIDNQTGERVFDTSLATAFFVSLEQSSHANVFPRSRIAAALKRMGKADDAAITEAVGREICMRERIRGLIAPSINKVGESYLLTARIIDPATGDTVRSYMKSADNQNSILSVLGSLAAGIRRDLGESLAAIEVSNKDLPQVTTSSIEALSLYANGTALWSRGKFDQGLELYLAALKLDPDFAMAHAAVGNAYNSHVYNRPADARAHLERAMQLSQRTTAREAQSIEIDYEEGLGHFEKVRSLYETFLKTYPDDFGMRHNYGNALRAHGDNEAAVAQYLEVLRLAPNDPNAYVNLATSYSSLERTDDALKAYARAFELEPSWMTSGNLNHEYGFTWVTAGDLAKAEDVFNKGLAAGNKQLSTRSLGLLHLYRGQYRKAIERLREAVVLNQSARAPLSESRNHLFLAFALDGVGDGKGSLAETDKAGDCLRTEIGQVWLVSRIGVEFARHGAIDKARRMLEKAEAEAEPTNPRQSSELHRLRGEIALAAGEQSQGVELLRLADAENHWPLTMESVARAYRVANDLDKAIPAYEALLALRDSSLGWEPQQDWLSAHYWLAVLLERRGNTEKAGALVEQMLALWTDADPDLPMLRSLQRLRSRLAAPAGED